MMDNTKLFLDRYKQLGEVFTPSTLTLKKALRVNTLKITPEKLLAILHEKGVTTQPIPYLEWGYWFTAPFSLGATPEYLQGYYYLQEAASQVPVQVLHPTEKDLVLDMAASPGSKTTQIAQYMQNKGVLIALDNQTDRLFSLKNNLERLDITNVLVLKKDARFASDLKQQFDKILLDAPCSGNFLTEPLFFKKKTLEGIQERAVLQKELLKSAHLSLKKRGTLVYSTCSLEPEENELVVQWVIDTFPDMQLQKTGLEVGDPGFVEVFGESLHKDLALTRRLWPHKTGTQGFFIAKFLKSE